VLRGRRPGLLRKPGGKGLILLERVAVATELSWLDLAQNVHAGVRLDDEGRDTRATAFVNGPFWRLYAEGARGLPRLAVSRLYDLCQTAAGL
jgi:hypothetical protein